MLNANQILQGRAESCVVVAAIAAAVAAAAEIITLAVVILAEASRNHQVVTHRLAQATATIVAHQVTHRLVQVTATMAAHQGIHRLAQAIAIQDHKIRKAAAEAIIPAVTILALATITQGQVIAILAIVILVTRAAVAAEIIMGAPIIRSPRQRPHHHLRPRHHLRLKQRVQRILAGHHRRLRDILSKKQALRVPHYPEHRYRVAAFMVMVMVIVRMTAKQHKHHPMTKKQSNLIRAFMAL